VPSIRQIAYFYFHGFGCRQNGGMSADLGFADTVFAPWVIPGSVLIRVPFDVSNGHAELIARDGLILDVIRLADRIGLALDRPDRPAPR
jgi:hypothetical protein